MKKKEIVLIAALVVFGLIYQAVEKGKLRFANEFSFYTNERKLKGSQFIEFTETDKLFQDVNKIIVENPAGEVTISKSVDNQVHVLSVLRIYYSNKSDLDELRKNNPIKSEFHNGELKIYGPEESVFPFHRIRILFRLLVPENIALVISNAEGDTIIKNTGKEIRVDQENGNLFLDNIPSSLQLRLKNCHAKINGIAENAEIITSRSDISLENVASLRFKGNHGDCSVKKVKNDVIIEQSYGKLVLDDIGHAEITARHCNIIAKNIKNGAAITNKYENIFLENILGDIRVASRLSKTELRHISSQNVVIDNSYADVLISGFSGGNLDVLLKNGNLDLQVENVTNRINIESQHAKLNLSFGVLADPTFNIRTRYGRIHTQSSLAMENFEEGAERFVNRVGQNPEILINNEYGDILIKTQN